MFTITPVNYTVIRIAKESNMTLHLEEAAPQLGIVGKSYGACFFLNCLHLCREASRKYKLRFM
jgi:hypothetical protein